MEGPVWGVTSKHVPALMASRERSVRKVRQPDRHMYELTPNTTGM